MTIQNNDVSNEKVIKATQYWFNNTVIGFNFCPFAVKEFKRKSIVYTVHNSSNQEKMLSCLAAQTRQLIEQPELETALIILPTGLESFFDYLDFFGLAEELNSSLGNEGVFQLASFHPDYCFEGVSQNDSSNFTNRSPYPIIHVLREASITRVLENYENPEDIPETNIRKSQKLGATVFRDILEKSRQQ